MVQILNKCLLTLSRGTALRIVPRTGNAAFVSTQSSLFGGPKIDPTLQSTIRQLSTQTQPRKLQVHKKSTNFAEAVEIVEQKIVEPQADEVRVRQLYAGVNATDINITAGRYMTDGVPPFSIGMEGVGVVDAVGSGVTNFKVGDAVAILHGDGLEGFSNYTVKKAKTLLPIPSPEPQYLGLLVGGLAAAIGLEEQGHIKAGEKVLITAAAGGTGHVAVQWAKAKGCYVISTASTQEKEDYHKSIGCDHVINYRKKDLEKTLAEEFPDGIDVAWETIGGEVYRILFENLALRGRMVVLGSIESYKAKGAKAKPIDKFNFRLFIKSQMLSGFNIYTYQHLVPEYFGKLVQAVQDGKIKIRVDNGERSGTKFEGLENVVKAEEWLHNSKNIGKVVVKIADL